MTMQKLIEKLIDKIGGIDKVAHFGVGCMICFFCTTIGLMQEWASGFGALVYVIIGVAITAIAAAVKELIIDDQPALDDFLWSIIGCIPVIISILIGALL